MIQCRNAIILASRLPAPVSVPDGLLNSQHLMALSPQIFVFGRPSKIAVAKVRFH